MREEDQRYSVVLDEEDEEISGTVIDRWRGETRTDPLSSRYVYYPRDYSSNQYLYLRRPKGG